MAHQASRPKVTLRSTASGHTYITRKNHSSTPSRLTLRKYDPIVRRIVEFQEK